MQPLIQAALSVIALAGGCIDLRSRKLPNWLNLSGFVLGLGLNLLLDGAFGLKRSLLGFGLAMLIYLALYWLRAMGAGDVKFMAALGSIVGPEYWFRLFIATAILGGFASMVLIMVRGRMSLTMANLSTITTELLHGRMPFRKDPSLDVHDARALGLPHGTLIAIGAMVLIFFWRS